MRIALLALLLVVCVSAGLFGSSKDTTDKLAEEKGLSLKEKIKDKLKNAWNSMKKVFNTTSVMKIHEKFTKLRKNIAQKLTLSPEQYAALAKKLESLGGEKIWPKRRERINPEGDNVDEINRNNGVGELLYQGDVVLSSEQADEIFADIEDDGTNRAKRQAMRDQHYPLNIWRERLIPYSFDVSANSVMRSVFKKGAALWAKDTCIDFVESQTAPDRIIVFKGDGCFSAIGRHGGEQPLSLGPGCETVGTAAHELGHALGMFHTHARYDRDRAITIDFGNIQEKWLDQYNKQSMLTNDNYGTPYDYGTLMHYPALGPSKDGNPVMMPKDLKYILTLGSHLISFYELMMINKHYKCMDNCAGKSNVCKNGGFLHPRDCTKCICPSGYGGNFCDQRPAGCGKVLQATNQVQTLTDVLGYGSEGTLREDFEFCNYWIEAPAGSKIEVKLKSFPPGFASDCGCVLGAVEIKALKDQTLTGYRMCSDEDAGENRITFTSASSLMPIITFNRGHKMTTVLEYRIASSDGSAPQPRPQPLPQPSSTICADSPICSARRVPGYCSNPAFSENLKKTLCARTCGYCR